MKRLLIAATAIVALLTYAAIGRAANCVECKYVGEPVNGETCTYWDNFGFPIASGGYTCRLFNCTRPLIRCQICVVYGCCKTVGLPP